MASEGLFFGPLDGPGWALAGRPVLGPLERVLKKGYF